MFETIFLMDKFYRIFLIFEIKHEDQLLNDSFFYYQKSEKIKNKERIEREERWRIEREEAGEEAGEEELPSADFGGGNRDVPEYIIGNLEEEIIEKLNDYPIIKDVYPGEQEQELKSEIKKIKKRLIQKTLTQFGINALKEAKRKESVSGAPFLLSHMLEMGYLRFHELLMGDPDRFDICIYVITKKGEDLLNKWKL